MWTRDSRSHDVSLLSHWDCFTRACRTEELVAQKIRWLKLRTVKETNAGADRFTSYIRLFVTERLNVHELGGGFALRVFSSFLVCLLRCFVAMVRGICSIGRVRNS